MKGFELNEHGSAVTTQNVRQQAALEAQPPNPVLWAMAEQKERNRRLFKRFVIARTQPEPVHTVRQTPYIGFYERGEQ